jgi:hypothetical protein
MEELKMSKFMIASEENIEHLEHYGVKGMKWRQHRSTNKSGSPTVYTMGANGQTVKVGESIKSGAARGGLGGVNGKGSVFSKEAKPKQSGKPSYGYATRDENGQLQYYSSKGEQHAANEKRKQAKKEKIKSKFKNLGERIKNTAKGLKK